MALKTYGRWPWISAALTGPSLAGAFARREWLAADGRWVAGLAAPLLFAHQAEEWVWPGGFLPFVNERVLKSGEARFPLTERLGLAINAPIGWGTAVGGLLLWDRSPDLAAAVLAIELGNVGLHGGMLLRTRTYNPGAATAVGLFAPHVVAGARWLIRSGRAGRGTAAAALTGLGFGLALPTALKLRMRHARRSDAPRRSGA